MHHSEISALAKELNSLGQKADRGPIDLSKTAHVIVDMQNAFIGSGAPLEIPNARKIIDNINRVSNAVRQNGGLNVFLRFTIDENEPNPWTPMLQSTRPETLVGLRELFRPGNEPHDLAPDLDLVPNEDIILDKTRFSGFIAGTCDLPNILVARKIERIIVTGTMTNCCCEATARDAMQLGYSVILLEDACATHNDEMHNGTLSTLHAFGYAEITATDQVLVRMMADASA